MKWVQCKTCKAEYPVSSEDDPKDWEEPCEFCGGSEWTIPYQPTNEQISLLER